MDDLQANTKDFLQLSRHIDYTLLRADATLNDYKKHCEEAVEYNFFSVCVPPHWLAHCKRFLHNTEIKLCTVIGFPFGYNTHDVKTFEAQRALAHGADELDMVMNLSAFKSGDLKAVENDIRNVVKAASGKPVKVIIETHYLNNEEKIKAALLCQEARAQFVKTSTGFAPGGAKLEDIELLRKALGTQMQIKASGGIRDIETARAFIKAGASRIGTQRLFISLGAESY